jgi:hypothetical protein
MSMSRVSSCSLTGPDAYHFELHRSDAVTLVMIDVTNTDTWEPVRHHRDGPRREGSRPAEEVGQRRHERHGQSRRKRQDDRGRGASLRTEAVTDKLIAGGKLTATFTEKRKEGAGAAANDAW